MRVVKRLFDFLTAFFLIIILSPLFLMLGFLTKIKLRETIIFRQQRVGRYHKTFTLYKFRTIKNGKSVTEDEEVGDHTLTKFARFMRHSSLDELPQLFNILKGDMSFIGPRPKTIFECLLLKDTDYLYRHAIKPGLTGWSVINGRNNLRNDKALEYDLIHVARSGLFFDLMIFFKTFVIVLRRTGINSPGKDTFTHLASFLSNEGYLSEEELGSVKRLARTLNAEKAPYLPLEVPKDAFKRKEKTLRASKGQPFVINGWSKSR